MLTMERQTGIFWLCVFVLHIKILLALILFPQQWAKVPYKLAKVFAPDLLCLIIFSKIGECIEKYLTKKKLYMVAIVFWICFTTFMFMSDYWPRWWWIYTGIYSLGFFSALQFQMRGTKLTEAAVFSVWSVVLASFLWEAPYALRRQDEICYLSVTYAIMFLSLCLFIGLQTWSRRKGYLVLPGTVGYLATWILTFLTTNTFDTTVPIGTIGWYLVAAKTFLSRIATMLFLLSLNYRSKNDEYSAK